MFEVKDHLFSKETSTFFGQTLLRLFVYPAIAGYSKVCHQWVMSLKPLDVQVPITKLPTLVEKKIKTDGLKRHTRTNALLYESPKDSLGKCFVLLSIGTHLMKL